MLRSPGQPLDAQTRALMEPRFGHDFSNVRVHADAKGAESARAVRALAYTVGPDVVFGAGQYALSTKSGQSLLAHELTHVVQQTSSVSTLQAELEVGAPHSPAEIEADQRAHDVMQDIPLGNIRADAPTLRRQDLIDVELVPVTREAQEENKKLGIDLPTVSHGVWRIIGGVADNAKKTLIEPEKKNIQTVLKNAKIPAGTPLASPLGGRFLLHDTSAAVAPGAIQAQQTKGRGPLGSGVSAYVPAQGAATITRPNFFEARRPSTSEFEKNLESFAQPADKTLSSGAKIKAWKKRRDVLFRDVWNATQPSKQTGAFNKALAGTQLTATEIKEERTGNNKKRDDDDFNPGVDAALKAGSTEKITTSSAWTVEEICKLVTPATVSSVAVAGQESNLTSNCASLSAFFTERNLRVSSTVPVEIVQPGVKKGATNQNTCDPTNPDIIPLSNPPYSADQYNNIALLYLRAANIAGMFPEITTHFVVDAFIQGHCDPRCFNLNQLYDVISGTMGHGKGSTYGVKPSYGRRWGTDSVWWNDTICHGPHP
ncbi:MAG: DUF4157 domain-containing protein [Acidobacteriota bacterium]